MTSFISPMLASPPRAVDFSKEPWYAEEKYDGIRLVVGVSDVPSGLFAPRTVRTWSRYGKERIIPAHIREVLEALPAGVYDGELLVPGKRSYGTAALENLADQIFVCFDVLSNESRDWTGQSYVDRRRGLRAIQDVIPGFEVSASRLIASQDEVDRWTQEVWDSDGEGLILKRGASPYRPGKRTKDWIKVKQLRTAVLTVVGYVPGLNGPQATVRLRDDEGCETTVKTRNGEWLDRLADDPESFIGRSLRIEYQERTPDGSYRHPRWDRWEDE